ncbi:MAG: hypothetical protein P1R58_02535 [bacterium]|nr:hypothetical protein [bacterium]
MRITTVIFLLVGLCLIGCDEEETPTSAADVLPANRYEGHVVINMRESAPPYYPIERTDSVTLSVSGDVYALTFQTDKSHICGSIGKISYNTEVGWITLEIENTTAAQCDTLRTPRGSFESEIKGRDLNMTGEYIIGLPNSDRDDTIKYRFDLTAP